MTDDRKALADRLEVLDDRWMRRARAIRRSIDASAYTDAGAKIMEAIITTIEECRADLTTDRASILAALRQPSADGAGFLGPNIYELVGAEIERHENWEAEVPLETIYKHNEEMTDAILEALSGAGYLSCAAMRSIKNGASQNQSVSQQTPSADDAFRRGAKAMREAAAKLAHYYAAYNNTGSGFDSNSAYTTAARVETGIRALPLPEPKP